MPTANAVSQNSLSPDKKILLSRHDVAALLSVSVRTIDYLIASKELPVRRLGRRTLVARSDVERFIKSNHPTR